MSNNIKADIQNQIYEAGILREGEQVVLISRNCVLLESFTGKVFLYRMVDLNSMKATNLYSRVRPIPVQGYSQVIAKMHMIAEDDESYELGADKNRAANLLIRVFTEILPKNGMLFRENQLSLALFMLQAMQENKIALCEAEVGTGKTHAYILAAVMYQLFENNRRPTIISTSTIALQKAIVEEYIPQISSILMQHRIIDRPLCFAVRKGKSHYACDSRVRTYLSSIRHNNRKEDRELIDTLNLLFAGALPVDLDSLQLTDYVKRRICVEKCHRNCDLMSVCRYRTHIRKTLLDDYDFQITNHNFVIADVLSRKENRNGLLPVCGRMVIDEAHKLLDVARQMYGMEFESKEIEQLAVTISRSVKYYKSEQLELYQLCNQLLQENQLFFENLSTVESMKYDGSQVSVYFTVDSVHILRRMLRILQRLSLLFSSADENLPLGQLNLRIEQKQTKIMILLDSDQSVCWVEGTNKAMRVCTLPKTLDFLLYEDLWIKEVPYILTSGTLSVGGDFRRYKRQTGLDFLKSEHVLEVSKTSPFDYNEHALLFLPKTMPNPDMKNPGYLNAIAGQILELVNHTYGHTLVLFTSYRMMELAFQRLSEMDLQYPLFMMGKGRLAAIQHFRESGNGVLLASDSAGEGIDLPGDILSSLIIVRLPFPAPDAVMEYERTTYETFHDFFVEVVMPAMLVKLRQWIGRGIRREEDTCVLSILDSRAANRYRKQILGALPDMPVTDSLVDVGRFIREKKSDEYFNR